MRLIVSNKTERLRVTKLAVKQWRENPEFRSIWRDWWVQLLRNPNVTDEQLERIMEIEDPKRDYGSYGSSGDSDGYDTTKSPYGHYRPIDEVSQRVKDR